MAQTKEEKKEYMKGWREKNKQKLKDYDSEYRKKNIEKVRAFKNSYYHRIEKHNITEEKRLRMRESVRKSSKKRSELLLDSYINKRLKHDGLTVLEIKENPILIEVKRIILKTKRL